MRIVLDTNVLVSALLNPNGVPASIVNVILDDTVTILVDDRILLEYREVLRRPKFAFPRDALHPLLEFFEHHSEYVSAGPAPVSINDPGDVPFYEVAVAADADFLVTGNTRHFPEKHWIVSPGRFIEIIRRGFGSI
ncbi:MAG: putative toxin-antitoxin system toxin component, PIN family [Spirochaetaceae bacterium]|nr:MAG: putative toxin-antitoxin system toxin component, PIN family [Spirochaetaceae bacterium]